MQNKVKVYVRTFDGTSFWANVFLEEGQRVQDLMNDERRFIPMERLEEKRGVKSEDVNVMINVHKDAVYIIEER